MQLLGPWEITFVAIYLAAVLFGGWVVSRRKGGTEDFFLGGRSIPWPAVLLSITATEISAVTFLGIPGTGYGEDLSYLQLGVGSLLARFLVAFLFLGAFYRSQCVSIYQYLGERFGKVSHRTSAVFFLVSRINASAIRLLLAAAGLSLFFGVPIWVAVLVFSGVALVYTSSGGIRAVIWTDCIQAAVFIAGGIAVFVYLTSQVGFGEFWEMAQESGKLQIFHWNVSPGESWFSDWNLFYLAALNGLVMTSAALGCDQDLTQRMLTCRSVGRARWSVILSGFLGIPIAGLFLLSGVALWAWVQAEGVVVPAEVGTNDIFAWFIAEVAPSGLRALLFIGILATAMSSLDSALNALSSSVVYDLVGERFRQSVAFSRWGIVFFGCALAGIAILLSDYQESFVWLGFKIGGVTYGALLGIFLLALTTPPRVGHDWGNVIAMLLGTVVSAILLLSSEMDWISLGWTWIPLINVAMTFLLAFCFRSDRGDSSEWSSSKPVS
ncbi:sodium:solute symporter family transporter [Puniceicoccus vermicola]|uniref:Sodium/solute symporter n=1 Tax=Puniceicoccus vermicola TaxID=388746 RepID=A0A7X1B228_9BACT|nr:sodium/solute symporter [Puniceicoccus vermicola]MBC2604199.1 sodium/solute symporter [Puniceicoccus vermicola]